MSKSIDDIIQHIEMVDSTVKLTRTKPIDEYEDEEIIKILRKFYFSNDPTARHVGTLLNAAFCTKSRTFSTSKNIHNDLLKQDKNIVANTINTKYWKKFMWVLVSNGIIECLRPATRNMPGIYKIVQDDVRAIMSRQAGDVWFDEQEKQYLHWYDTNAQAEEREKPTSKELTREEEYVKNYYEKVKPNAKRIFS
jgi:hypothetical protein